jgi:hypothetical protein
MSSTPPPPLRPNSTGTWITTMMTPMPVMNPEMTG